MYLSINGELKLEEDLKISVNDRSFLFGDNVFETMLYKNSSIIEFDLHIERLMNSANKIYIQFLYSKNEIESFVNGLIEKNDLEDCMLRVMLTRGVGDRGINIEKCNNPNLIITQTKLNNISEEEYINGKSINIVSTNKISSKDSINIKSGALYLENMIAKHYAIKAGYDDALMLDSEGNILECTTANIFWVKNNKLYTPNLSLNILPGITRKTLIDTAKPMNLEIIEGIFQKEELKNIDEVFITYSSAGIMPITKINEIIISNNKIGPITLSLLKAFWGKYDIDLPIHENTLFNKTI